MSNPMIRIHNTQTNEVIDREMNAEELAQWQADQAEASARQEAQAAKAADRAALLNRLGITADEAQLLLS